MATSVGQIYRQTFEILKSRIWLLLGIWVTYFAVQMVSTVLISLVVGVSAMSGLSMGDPGALSAGMIVPIVVLYLVYFFIYFAQIGSLTAMGSPLKQLTFGAAFNAGIKSAPTLLGVVFLLMLVYLVGMIVIGLASAVLSFVGPVGLVFSIIIFLPILVYLGCRLSLVYPVVAVESMSNPVTAITRAWSETKGHVLTIFLSVVGLFAVAMIVLLLVAMPIISTAISSRTTGELPNFASIGFSLFGLFCASILLSIVGAVLVSTIHAEIVGPLGHDESDVFS